VGCVAATGFPGPVRQGTAFREHRTVMLPDFQGLGIGTRMSNAVASAMLSSAQILTSAPCRVYYVDVLKALTIVDVLTLVDIVDVLTLVDIVDVLKALTFEIVCR